MDASRWFHVGMLGAGTVLVFGLLNAWPSEALARLPILSEGLAQLQNRASEKTTFSRSKLLGFPFRATPTRPWRIGN